MKTATAKVLHCEPEKGCRIVPRPKSTGGLPPVPAFPGGLKKILVPVDFSPRTRKALNYALPMAKDYAARICLICAAAPVPYEMDYGYGPVSREIPDESAVKKTTARLHAFARRNVPKVRLGETVVRSGNPAVEIVRVATELEIDCVVICTRRRPEPGDTTSASIAEQLIHNAPCPVIVLHEE